MGSQILHSWLFTLVLPNVMGYKVALFLLLLEIYRMPTNRLPAA